MVRGKTQMKLIENTTSRQVTFSKRRNGLLKKASELSVLCDAEVALIIFSTGGKLYEFSSSNMSNVIERYEGRLRDTGSCKIASQDDMQPLEMDTLSIAKKIEIIEASKRKLMGNDLDGSSCEELQQLEKQLERSLSKIRARKSQLFKEQIERLKEEEKKLLEENKKLLEKMQCGMKPRKFSLRQQEISRSRESIDVETELFIGPPERRGTRA